MTPGRTARYPIQGVEVPISGGRTLYALAARKLGCDRRSRPQISSKEVSPVLAHKIRALRWWLPAAARRRHGGDERSARPPGRRGTKGPGPESPDCADLTAGRPA